MGGVHTAGRRAPEPAWPGPLEPAEVVPDTGRLLAQTAGGRSCEHPGAWPGLSGGRQVEEEPETAL